MPDQPSESQPVEKSSPLSLPVSDYPGEPKLKVLFLVLIVLLIGAAGFVAFRFFSPRLIKPPKTSLTYWGLWEPERVMGKILAEWEKKHPEIKINYVRQSPQEYRERLQSALARNEGPDIFRFHITWLPMLKNELEPLPASVMSARQFEKTYYPVAQEHLRAGGSYLGIPLMIDTLALYYNEEIFQAAGKSPPTTWEELRDLAKELTIRDEVGRIQRAGVALGTTGNVDHWSDILGLMMLQNGADLTKPDSCFQSKDGALPSAETCLGVDALIFYTFFNQVDQVWDETLPSSTLAFATGRLAMYFAPSWRVFNLKEINPNLRFRIAPVPQLPGTEVTWASFWVEGVAKRSENKEAAWEFLKFLSSPQTMEKLYQAESQLRLFGEPYARVEMASKLANDPMVAPFLDQAPKAQTWYLCSRTFDNGINERMIKYFEDAVNSVNSGKNPQKALETATQGVAQLLSQYGVTAGF